MNADTVAVVFPGQGSQRNGMGADFCREFPVARAVFEEAGDALGEDLLRLCTERDPRLHRTEFTQPCVLTMSIAAYRTLTEHFGLAATLFGGHSLGEYTALVAAGAMSLTDAVRLVHSRGQLMARAVPEGTGAMAALILPDIAGTSAARIATNAGAEIANENSPAQLVISGKREALTAARAALAEALPELRFVPLRVSGPFHSRLMATAETEFAAELRAFLPRIDTSRAGAVTSNVTGGFHRPDELAQNLIRQIGSPVHWLSNMRALTARTDTLYEVGPTTPLTPLFTAIGAAPIGISTVDTARSGTQRARNGADPGRTDGERNGRTVTNGTRVASARALTLHRSAVESARLRLICWPYAGGSAANYAEWRRAFDDGIEVGVAELPGRRRSSSELRLRTFDEMATAAVDMVTPLSDLPLVFFGHSMGALLAYEVACRIAPEAMPLALFVSGSTAPHLARPPSRLSDLPDREFVDAVSHYGGIPAEVLGVPEVLSLFLPALRADFVLLEDFRYIPRPSLSCPVFVYGGRDDRYVAASQLEAWRDLATDVRAVELFPGGHFYLTEHRTQLLSAIRTALSQLAVAPGRRG